MDRVAIVTDATRGIAGNGKPVDVGDAVVFLFAPDSHRIDGTAPRVDDPQSKAL